MTSLLGHERAHAALLDASSSGVLHHAWLLAGPKGVGKAAFAHLAAKRLLAEAHPGAPPLAPGTLAVPDEHPTARYLAAGGHPDLHLLIRLPKDKDKPDAELARSIRIDQVRELFAKFAVRPSIGVRRVVILDAVDDLESQARHAVLKQFEEPPAGTIFLLVSHAPGRLLPTIRSRCRLLRFDPLGDEDMAKALGTALPKAEMGEVRALVRTGAGSPGRALGYAGLDIAAIDAALMAIAGDGDRDNARRLRLSQALAGKAAQPRFEAFLERAPSFLAEQAAQRRGPALRIALDAYASARELAGSARRLSLDPQTTAFELASLIARLAPPPPSG